MSSSFLYFVVYTTPPIHVHRYAYGMSLQHSLMFAHACMVEERTVYKTEFHGENVKIPFEVPLACSRIDTKIIKPVRYRD